MVGKKYPWGDEAPNANLARFGQDRSRGKPQPVGSYPANGYGLYDMAGNVWEWCADWYGSYASGWVDNPKGPNSGDYCVLRGGSWLNNPNYLRVANRNNNNPTNRNNNGFRCAQHFPDNVTTQAVIASDHRSRSNLAETHA